MKAFEPIILASASPRRKKMFEDLCVPFEVVPADIDEQMNDGETPGEFACRAGLEKGMAVAERLASDSKRPWVVSADTVVVLDGSVLVKPRDLNESKEMISRLSGNTHTVITGWTVGRHLRPWITRCCETGVTFHKLTTEQIDGYVATKEGMDKAGSYAIQGLGTFLVDRIEGNYFNVVGLPISHVMRALIEVGALPGFPLP